MPTLTATEREILDQFDRDRSFLAEHIGELREKYRQQWVAVHRGEVAAAAAKFEALLSELKRRGITPYTAVIEFITDRPRSFLF